jgi:hypothetical protein
VVCVSRLFCFFSILFSQGRHFNHGLYVSKQNNNTIINVYRLPSDYREHALLSFKWLNGIDRIVTNADYVNEGFTSVAIYRVEEACLTLGVLWALEFTEPLVFYSFLFYV